MKVVTSQGCFSSVSSIHEGCASSHQVKDLHWCQRPSKLHSLKTWDAVVDEWLNRVLKDQCLLCTVPLFEVLLPVVG